MPNPTIAELRFMPTPAIAEPRIMPDLTTVETETLPIFAGGEPTVMQAPGIDPLLTLEE